MYLGRTILAFECFVSNYLCTSHWTLFVFLSATFYSIQLLFLFDIQIRYSPLKYLHMYSCTTLYQKPDSKNLKVSSNRNMPSIVGSHKIHLLSSTCFVKRKRKENNYFGISVALSGPVALFVSKLSVQVASFQD